MKYPIGIQFLVKSVKTDMFMWTRPTFIYQLVVEEVSIFSTVRAVSAKVL